MKRLDIIKGRYCEAVKMKEDKLAIQLNAISRLADLLNDNTTDQENRDDYLKLVNEFRAEAGKEPILKRAEMILKLKAEGKITGLWHTPKTAVGEIAKS